VSERGVGVWVRGTFAALDNRHFRILFAGTSLTFIAFFMSLPVQAVVAFDLSGTNQGVGWVIAGQGLAQLILGPFGGALADRFSKKLILLTCQVVITCSFGALAVLVVTDAITVPLLVVGSFLIGSAFSFLGPARQALLVELVGPGRRGNAIALMQVALNGSRVLAPMVATVFLGVSALGPGGAYFAMMGLYVGAMYSTTLMPRLAPPAGAGRAVLGEVASGFGYVWRTRNIRLLVLSYILIIAIGFAYTAVLPGLVKNGFDRPASDITLLLLANAAGGLLASFAVAAVADTPRAGALYTALCVCFGAALVLTGLAPAYWLVVGTMFLVGAAGGGFQTLNGVLVSHRTNPAYFGRVVALTFLAFAVSSLVALPFGALADRIGETETILASGIAVSALALLFAAAGRTTPRPAGTAPSPAPGG
jgi:MFS family permease